MVPGIVPGTVFHIVHVQGTLSMNLIQAIDRSHTHDERVSVEFVGTREQLLVELHNMIDSDLEIDDATENDGTIDVWCFDPHQSTSEMIWRLCANLV